MPQMSPIWWTMMFIMFISLLLMTCPMIYYSMMPKFNKHIEQPNKNMVAWKW